MLYSIIIPAYNEEESVKELYKKLKKVMDSVAADDYEILYINDGSTDRTLERIKSIMKNDPSTRVVSFRKNSGKAAALSIGFEKSVGKYIITMDADLQDEPNEIPKLIDKLNEGYDMVSGWKENRQDPIDKTLPSKVFNFLVSRMSGLKFHDFNCGFKIYKREVVKEIAIYGQLYRFIPVLVFQRGFKVAEVKVKHNKRKYGKSKYNWTRIFAGIADLITVSFMGKYGKRPMHFFGLLGGILFLTGFGMMIYLAVYHFTGHSIFRRPLLVISVAFLISGLQITMTGLIAEMLTNMNHSNKKYPIIADEE